MTLRAADVINGQSERVPEVAVLTALFEMGHLNGWTGVAASGAWELFSKEIFRHQTKPCPSCEAGRSKE